MTTNSSQTPVTPIRGIINSESRLAAAAAEIIDSYARISTAMQDWVRMGFILWEVKSLLPHGTFTPWKAHNLPNISKSHLANAMTAADSLCRHHTGLSATDLLASASHSATVIDDIVASSSSRTKQALLVSDSSESAKEAEHQAWCRAQFAADPDLEDRWLLLAESSQRSWAQIKMAILGKESCTDAEGRKLSSPSWTPLINRFRGMADSLKSAQSWDLVPSEAQEILLSSLTHALSFIPPTQRRLIINAAESTPHTNF